MRTKSMKTGLSTLLILVLFFSPIYAQEALYQLPAGEETAEFLDMDLTVEEVVAYTLENSTVLKTLDNKLAIAGVQKTSANASISDMEDAQEALEDAEELIEEKEELLDAAQDSLDTAVSTLEAGYAPVDIPLEDESGDKIVDGSDEQVVIAQGSNIEDALLEILNSDYMAETVEEQVIATVTQAYYDTLSDAAKEACASQVIAAIADKLVELIEENLTEAFDESQDTITESYVAIDEATETLEASWTAFDTTMEDASDEIESKINYTSSLTLDVDDASDLMLTMANVNLDVTRYAKEIYNNQIAMLVCKNFYDALYAQKVLAVKEAAMERGKTQFDMIELSYNNGMKAKDDYLLSKMYYNSTVISKRLAEAQYNNAMYELKKNMNISIDSTIVLVDSLMTEVKTFALKDGLSSGLTKRIEVQQILGELEIYKLNEEIIGDMYQSNTKNYRLKEAELLRTGAEIELAETKRKVESDIYQSYELMEAAAEMMVEAQDLVANAQEVVDIAKLKYEQGFGSENALLKDLNLESSSGTILELIAANEKLTDIEAQTANIRYNYTMAVIKYQNDAGLLIY